MKKMVMTLVAVCCCVLTTSAQEARNCVYDITLGHVEYVHHDEKMSAGEGDDISRCKVQSGGKDIKACLEAGEQLVVMSRDM